MADVPAYDYLAGTGPTLVFLHYWGGSSRTWSSVADLLTGHGVLRFDSRGWSHSARLPGPYTLQQHAADVPAILDDAGVSEFVLVGHSMGGKVAQLVAAKRPAGLRGVVLVGPGPAVPPATITSAYREQLAHAYDSAESVAFVRDHVLTATVLTDALAAQVLDDSRAGSAEATAAWPSLGITEDISAQSRRIEVPALVIAGERDVVEPETVLRENLMPYLGNACLVVLPGSGHLMPLEAPAALAAAIVTFLDALPGKDDLAATSPGRPRPGRSAPVRPCSGDFGTGRSQRCGQIGSPTGLAEQVE